MILQVILHIMYIIGLKTRKLSKLGQTQSIDKLEPSLQLWQTLQLSMCLLAAKIHLLIFVFISNSSSSSAMHFIIDPLLQIDDLVVILVGIHPRWWSSLHWMVNDKPIAVKIKIVAEIKKQELHFAISWKGIYTNKLSF